MRTRLISDRPDKSRVCISYRLRLVFRRLDFTMQSWCCRALSLLIPRQYHVENDAYRTFCEFSGRCEPDASVSNNLCSSITNCRYMRRIVGLTSSSLVAICIISCATSIRSASEVAHHRSSAPLFTVTDQDLGSSPRFIVYGDMRFTNLAETEASLPGPRRALVARIGREKPDAVFLTGDVPWHGGNSVDYDVCAQETAAWRSEQLRVYPVLGNHEFQGCWETECLAHWWHAFPQESGRRWYSVALGSKLLLIALDSDSSLHSGSEQGRWLKGQLDDLPAGVRFVVFLLHHPPVTDAADGVRSNEAALAQQLAAAALASRARFIVCAAHVHNYERFQRDDILFLVSGGGGAKPEAVKRSAADVYQNDAFPNFHYLRFELTAGQLRGEMIHLDDNAAAGASWSVRDRFALDAKTP
jgi:hypothetical protein